MAGKDYPICPICSSVGESHNLKVCNRCQEYLLEKIEFAGDMEVELVHTYCEN